MTTGDLPEELEAWIGATTGGSVVTSRRHLAGASRQAWSVDVDRLGEPLELFLLRDQAGGRGGSARDAAVLRSLAGTPVPVPVVYGHDAGLGALLLERVPGRGDFPAVDHEDEREPTARHLMELTAALHRVAPASLPIDHLGDPAVAGPHAEAQLAGVERFAALAGDGLDPLFRFALVWLRCNVPDGGGRTSLVHSDMGPGNFLAASGRVTAILDWEVAHWGDPMEDLAAVAVRDMATPVGHLPTRFAEYAAAGGPPVDLAAVAWYRILVLTRNPMLIGFGLARDDAAVDRVQMTMYRTMLMRACALALCDAVGVDRPEEPAFADAPAPSDEQRLVAHALRDQRATVLPELGSAFAAARAEGVAAVLGAVEQRLRFGAERAERELADLAALLGRRPAGVDEGLAGVAGLVDDPSRERDLAAFLARHLQREAMLLAPILGDLVDRYPQRLEDR
jgi:aminoglycoside phosphotransferase (APT) family kinase protein